MIRRWIPTKNNDPLIRSYREYRNVGTDMNSEILKQFTDEKSLRAIGKLLGIAQGRTFLLESEAETDLLMDFSLYEYQVDDKNMVQRYLDTNPELDETLKTLLDAMLKAETSFFKISETIPSKSRVKFLDLLNQTEVEIIDINLSKSAQPGMLMFTRIVPLPEFNVSSGIHCIFPGDEEKAILKRYKTLVKKVNSDIESIQRFVAFFKLNRTHGYETGTRNV